MSVTARHIIEHLDGHVASNPGRARAHADGAATQAIGQLPLGVKALNTHPVKSVPGVRSALMIAHIIVAPRLHLMTLRWCPSYSSATTVSLLAASVWLSSTKGSMVNETSRCALPLAVPRARVCVLCCLWVQLHVCFLFVRGRPRGGCEAGRGVHDGLKPRMRHGLNTQVRFGGVTFKTGQYLYSDSDGIIVSDEPLALG